MNRSSPPRILFKEDETHHGRDAVHGVHLEELRGFVLARHDVAHDQLVLDSVLLAETCAQTPIPKFRRKIFMCAG